MRTMAAGEFKAKCLAVMDEVQATGQPVLVTKRGKPVVRLTPANIAHTPLRGSLRAPAREAESADTPTGKKTIFGRLRKMGAITGDIVSSEKSDEDWDRVFDEKWARFEKASAR